MKGDIQKDKKSDLKEKKDNLKKDEKLEKTNAIENKEEEREEINEPKRIKIPLVGILLFLVIINIIVVAGILFFNH